MRLAIPEHRGRVAPVFDCCVHLLVFRQNTRHEELEVDEDWSMLPRLARVGRLRGLMVELVVCGGISCCLERQIRHHGIELIPWVAGELQEVLEALRWGKLHDPCYAMPGRAGCRRSRFRRIDEEQNLRRDLIRKGASSCRNSMDKNPQE
jgi:hypothetical protein